MEELRRKGSRSNGAAIASTRVAQRTVANARSVQAHPGGGTLPGVAPGSAAEPLQAVAGVQQAPDAVADAPETRLTRARGLAALGRHGREPGEPAAEKLLATVAPCLRQ